MRRVWLALALLLVAPQGARAQMLHSTEQELLLPEALDPSTTALLNRMTTKPALRIQGQINSIIKQLKAGDLWNRLDILYVPGVADTSQAATLNWLGSSYTLTTTGTCTFTALAGYACNAGACLNSNYTPSTNGVNWKLATASIIFGSGSSGIAVSGTQYFVGANDGTNLSAIQFNANVSGYTAFFLNGPHNSFNAGTITNGIYAEVLYPYSASGKGLWIYLNGQVQNPGTGTTPVAVPTYPVFFGGSNNAGTCTGSVHSPVMTVGAAGYFTATDMALFNKIMLGAFIALGVPH